MQQGLNTEKTSCRRKTQIQDKKNNKQEGNFTQVIRGSYTMYNYMHRQHANSLNITLKN